MKIHSLQETNWVHNNIPVRMALLCWLVLMLYACARRAEGKIFHFLCTLLCTKLNANVCLSKKVDTNLGLTKVLSKSLIIWPKGCPCDPASTWVPCNWWNHFKDFSRVFEWKAIKYFYYNGFAIALKRFRFWGVTVIRSDTWFWLAAVLQT